MCLLGYRSSAQNGKLTRAGRHFQQLIDHCSFSLANHIAGLDQDVGAPTYLEEKPILDLSSLVPEAGDPSSGAESDRADLYNVDVLEGFPKIAKSGMDDSQALACQRMLTTRLAIVQGPPGTGKTRTSVTTIKVLLSNLGPEEPPMIVAAQTNHALDQLMNHILGSEERIVRLGGRCDRENVELIKRTLYELRVANKNVPDGGKGLKACRIQLKQNVTQIQAVMYPLLTATLLTDDALIRHGLITQVQRDSLYENGWFETDRSQKTSECTFTPISTCKYLNHVPNIQLIQ
jgi:helicase required for RNAi-mediated heterochromatin assembly 1